MAEPGKDTRYRVVLGVGGGALVLDQLTKLWVMASLPYYGAVTVIPGFFDLVNIRNRGAAFGFLNRSDIQWHWPAFNVVDIAICCGALLVCLSMWLKGPSGRAS